MVEKNRQDGVAKPNVVKVNLDFPNFQLHVTSDRPVQALAEVRKIIEALNLDEEVVYEEFVTEELKNVFSETFIQHRKAMELVKKCLKNEDDYRLATVELATSAMLDLRDGTRSVRVKQKDVKEAVARLTSAIDKNVKFGIVHINGDLDREGRLLVADHIHKFMPTAQLRAFQSSNLTGKVVIECIFFGDFPEE